ALHQYQRSLAGNAPYDVQVTISDNDNASGAADAQLTVNSVGQTDINLDLASATINEGNTATLNGSFTDASANTHKVVVNWGDGSLNTTLSLDANVSTFSANHQYLDNLPGNAPYTIQVTVSNQSNASVNASAQRSEEHTSE